jgi:hypothetical protein
MGLTGFQGVPRSVIDSAVAETEGWKNLGQRMLAEVQNRCPVSDDDDGPHLKDTLVVSFISGADPRILIGTATKGDVLGYLTKGTDPHPIDPVVANVLHWVSGGQDFFASHVDHPGTQPNPFLLDACRAIAQGT